MVFQFEMSCSSSDETYEETYTSSKDQRAQHSDEVASTSTAGLGDCVVCSNPAHGLHFGVLSCRACAAFYRRTVVLSKQYACRRANKTCAINKEERYLCRYCRYQKCLAVGMQADNVQWNRDKVLSERMKAQAAARIPGQEPPPLTPAAQHKYGFDSKSPEDASFIQVHKDFFPAIRFFKKPDSSSGLSHPSNAPNILLDIGPVIIRVASIFENPPLMPDLGIRMTLMQRMLVGLQHVRRNQIRKPEICSFISAARGKAVWERQLFSIAEWAMHCEEFAQLPGDQKLAVYKGSWAAFFRLERFHLTVSIFGRALMEKGFDKSMILVLTDEIAVDFLSTDFDFTFITDYDQNSVKRWRDMTSVAQQGSACSIIPFVGLVPKGHKVTILNIPKGGTSLAQPLDLCYNQQWKCVMRRLNDAILVHDIDFVLHTRDNLLRCISQVYWAFGAPMFKEYRKYGWYRGGFLTTHPAPMFQPFCTRLYEEVAKPMIELQITDTELVYMLGQLMWHLEGRKGIAPETQAISESFRARISNELHDYYVYELKMNNYAARLMKLMGIVNDVENILYERNKVLELARIFDVFKIDLQDPGTIVIIEITARSAHFARSFDSHKQNFGSIDAPTVILAYRIPSVQVVARALKPRT
ncbi:nhr-142 [Pristionchus pacificus]|uniref:Nhr-142 protein n=1 Tax=Pristionchus pacificus TaxID=54126 RepID=A0A2A6C736_PRIPA|nr:nhr-142 [Pristionchus pacificus]|eukprot:PDM73920.1 nhr-142 protein [Pristionchus pacificus]